MRFTIFTPTYNRSHLIGGVFESLQKQTYRDFEWLIVDDGSSDDTEQRIRGWQSANTSFPIRFVRQNHGGKLRAHNLAIHMAEGELFAVLDSDDRIVPDALERLQFHWSRIPANKRDEFSGVACLCMDEASRIIGEPFPSSVLDCRHYELETRFGVRGEKWGCHRTSVLAANPFPECAQETHCPEGLVWNRIAQRYLVRHVNEPLRIYLPQADGLASKIRAVLMVNPRSARLFYQEWLSLEAPRLSKCLRAMNYVRYSCHAGVSLSVAVSQSPARTLTAAALAPGWLLHKLDHVRYGNGPAVNASAGGHRV